MGLRQRQNLGGVAEGRPWGASNYAFSNEKWMLDGYNLFMSNTGSLMRDFWIGQPLFSAAQNCFFNQAPAFWSIANKTMAFLLKRVNFLMKKITGYDPIV